MPDGIRFYSLVDTTGYGHAAIGYVRALVNAGAQVEWVPIRYAGDSAQVIRRDEVALATQVVGDGGLSDLPALLAATAAPRDPAVVAMWCIPEFWPSLRLPYRRNVGMTVWETDRIPAHWKGLLNSVDAVVVPSQVNREVFIAGGVRAPVSVVPHVRRHAWNAFSAAELAAARRGFGIADGTFVFYSIGTWDPRKALPLLLEAFAHAFTAGDDVALVLKMPVTGYSDPPYYATESTLVLANRVLESVQQVLGRPLPQIVLLPYELSTRGIDLLHALGDTYVSFSHGEGFGLGAFDAASRGTPVTMTDWGGQADYLGAAHAGAVRSRKARVPVFPPYRPSYWPSQRWADVTLDDAVAALLAARGEAPGRRVAARVIEQDIANRFAEPVIGPALRAALGG